MSNNFLFDDISFARLKNVYSKVEKLGFNVLNHYCKYLFHRKEAQLM